MPARRFVFCRINLLLATMFFAAFALTAAGRAEDFHVESSVFSGKDPKPVSQNTTIFRAGVVYDYLSDKTVAVFDKRRGRFLLIDPARKVKTEVKTDELQQFCDDLQERAAKDGNAYVKFLATPKFDKTVDEKTAELVLKSQYMTYRISTLKAETDAAAQQYREFSDWYARLNAMTNHTPPFARMAVNEELLNRGLVATQVQLNIPKQLLIGGHSVSLRSEHQITWKLLKLDLDKITETETQLGTFTPVSLEKFQHTNEITKR
jgi:hypothetical protein